MIGKTGAWVNNYAVPPDGQLISRGHQVDYLIIKSFMEHQIALAQANNIPFMVEAFCPQMTEQQAHLFGRDLANIAGKTGAIAAVLNVEYWDWDTTGDVTRNLIAGFRVAQTTMPLYTSLDTRRDKLDYPYQHILAELCDGVMPMCYPLAFQQTPENAVKATFNDALFILWKNKPVVATIQTYDNIGGPNAARTLNALPPGVVGYNAYTLGHATDAEWAAVVGPVPAPAPLPAPAPPPAPGDDVNPIAFGLIKLRNTWLETIIDIAHNGNVDDLAAFVTYWKGLTYGGKDK